MSLKSLWLLITNPLERAEQKYHLAAAKLANHEADLRFQISRLAFYRNQLHSIDPTKDWWRYAATQDKIEEHNTLLLKSSNKRVVLLSKYMSCSDKWQELRDEFQAASAPTVWTGQEVSRELLQPGDVWIDSELRKHTWDGQGWTT